MDVLILGSHNLQPPDKGLYLLNPVSVLRTLTPRGRKAATPDTACPPFCRLTRGRDTH